MVHVANSFVRPVPKGEKPERKCVLEVLREDKRQRASVNAKE